ncbi:MAG: hypothetical protein COB98_10255 [Flavobacteriaceae bacterium]|nr:MAG: hypothetical protein COB98_10255 [Flavobacteriaceae bacterium]
MKIFTVILITFGLFTSLGTQEWTEGSDPNELELIAHKIQYQKEAYTLNQAVDLQGVSQYYFIDIAAFPCKGKKECKLTQLRMYWDVKGDFLSIEVEESTPLTKLNHKKFTDKDYVKLHGILLDDSSDFKFLTLEDLTERQAENSFYETDAVSGATISSRDFECIHGAVKTTFQLWHFANGSLKDSIKKIEEKQEKHFLKTMGALAAFESEFSQSEKRLDNHIRVFTEGLSILKITTKKEKARIENIANAILSKGGKHGLVMYNFLIRKQLKIAKKAMHRFKKTL